MMLLFKWCIEIFRQFKIVFYGFNVVVIKGNNQVFFEIFIVFFYIVFYFIVVILGVFIESVFKNWMVQNKFNLFFCYFNVQFFYVLFV